MSGACLDESTVLAFLDGTLPGEARTEVEAHLAACSACTEIATWAAADLAGASRPSRAPGREGQPFLGQLAPGSRVGRYQVLGAVGRGGMGEVYAAYHPDLDRRIALKVVYESGAGSAERRARLLREARAIARLSHPNVVGVYDAGTVGDRVYIAMEFVDGDTLDEWLRAAPRTWREILDVFVAAGRGLAAAHAAELVHRDFKPQNVMIGKDGSVRVMDFGLARMVREEIGIGGEEAVAGTAAAEEAGSRSGQTVGRVTKTGALLGTPAYMAPEQWRGDPIDARADQFSFCVALHEALYGARPVLAHLDSGDGPQPASPDRSTPHRRAGAPVWLRAAILRGLAVDRGKRFESMDRLLATLMRGRVRTRRRASALAAGLAIALGTLGGWRLSHARRFDCKLPADRIAAAWAVGDPSNPRRQSIRAALLAGGGTDGSTIWGHLSSALDEYIGRWGAMYKETCEATHLRGEQSEEVLDLRMRCLNENLDEVRALTDVVARSERTATTQILSAVNELRSVARCADLQILRSAVPLPRDEQTLQTVLRLRQSVKEVRVLNEIGRYPEALDKAISLRPDVEATQYKPLLAELLDVTGSAQTYLGDSTQSEASLHEALVAAEAGGDDVTAAAAATNLIYVAGVFQGRAPEGKRWARLAHAMLDRLGAGHSRTRAWALENEGCILFQERQFEAARSLFERSISLKVDVLGSDHPDVAIGLASLGLALMELGNLQEALELMDRAVAITLKHGGALGNMLEGRGEVLGLLGRYDEARQAFERALRNQPADRLLAYSLTGLGLVELASGNPSAALPLLERALHIRERDETDAKLVAETRFALARALWETGRDRTRALSLARSAHEPCAGQTCPRQLRDVDAWLATHTKHRPN